MDIYQLIAAAAQQGGVSGTPSGPDSYYSYDTGTENDDWEQGYLLGGGSVTFGGSYVTINASPTSGKPPATGEAAMTTADKIDLTDYATITVTYSYANTGSGTFAICLDDTNKAVTYTSYDYRATQTPLTGGSTLQIDVSSVTGEYYIRVHVRPVSSKETLIIYVDSVYIEV